MKGHIASDDLEDLRNRADIVDLVSGYLKLKKAGGVFKGLCCFHQEKTPSFTVDPAKGLYYCHGCSKGGDVFSFIQEVEGLTFSESAQRIADRVGKTLRFEGPSEPPGQRAALLAANRQARDYFADLLAKGSEAKVARDYLESRGFDLADAAEWKLGFAPRGRDTLYRHLLHAGLKSNQIVEAGLALVVEGGQHRDRFRGRVIFPVQTLTGDTVGFGARALDDDKPKYLNSPETPLYQKSKILFGLDKAKAEIVRSGFAIVTEGYTDVIALHKLGFANAVATCGTALGEDHFALLKRFCERVLLAFDADAAGSLASERGFGIHSKIGLEVLVATVPAGKDPADVAIEEGRPAVQAVIDGAEPLMRFVLEKEIARHHLDTAEGKSKAVKAAVEKLSWEPNRVARSEHGFWLASKVGVAPEQVQLEIAESKVARHTSDRRTTSEVLRRPGHVKVEREALAILLDSPAELKRAVELVSAEHFTQPSHRIVFEAIVACAQGSGGESVMHLLPDESSRTLAAELSMAPVITKDPEEVFIRLEQFKIRRQIETLKAKLGQLDPEGDADSYTEVLRELMRLDVERRKFDDN
ncbi:MAG: DNA primase [Actinobacteria bacterium]|nr:DNA primase [Actinomycetota bacterium]